MFVRRPDNVFAEFNGDERHTKTFLSNGSLKIFDVRKRLYVKTPISSHIDEAMDEVFEKYGISVPISDFVYSNPYKVLVENALSGVFVGTHIADRIKAHHLAFTQEEIDWQIWINDGPMPVPLKLVIDYKLEPGSPRYTVRFTEWNFTPHISKQFFDFHPPNDVTEIDVLPVQYEEDQK